MHGDLGYSVYLRDPVKYCEIQGTWPWATHAMLRISEEQFSGPTLVPNNTGSEECLRTFCPGGAIPSESSHCFPLIFWVKFWSLAGIEKTVKRSQHDAFTKLSYVKTCVQFFLLFHSRRLSIIANVPGPRYCRLNLLELYSVKINDDESH